MIICSNAIKCHITVAYLVYSGLRMSEMFWKSSNTDILCTSGSQTFHVVTQIIKMSICHVYDDNRISTITANVLHNILLLFILLSCISTLLILSRHLFWNLDQFLKTTS